MSHTQEVLLLLGIVAAYFAFVWVFVVAPAIRRYQERESAALEAEAEAETPAEPVKPRRRRLSEEAMRLYEEVANGWWREVWGPKHPEPPYDWAQEGDSGSAFVGAGRGKAL